MSVLSFQGVVVVSSLLIKIESKIEIENNLRISKYLQLIYYIGLTITSYFPNFVVDIDWQKHDSTDHVDAFNYTCLSQTDFQCYQESILTGRSMFYMKCKVIVIEDPGEPTRYEVCDCGSRGKSRCIRQQCYVIQAYDMPEKCDYQKCSAFVGLEMWMSAATLGTIFGCIAIILIILSMHSVAKRSKNIDISSLYLIHLMALIPPVMVAFSMLTTDVLKQKAYVGLNAWAWTMVIGFGIPLCLGWIYNCQSTLSKAAKYYRSANEVHL